MDVNSLEARVAKLEQVVSAFSDELRLALGYVQSDAGSSLTKSRLVLEKLLLKVYASEMGQEPRKPLLGDMLADNQFTRKVERRILARMNTIRDIGNLGPHGEKVKPSDAAKVLDDLCEVLDWYLPRYSAGEGSPAEDQEADDRTDTVLPGQPAPGRKFKNTLGNLLVPVPGDLLTSGDASSLFVSTTCVSNADYLEFVRAGGPEPRGSTTSPLRRSWHGKQCPEAVLEHPVLYVPHADACEFCDWLTRKERRQGRIESRHRYSLPSSGQWKAWAAREPLPRDAVLDRGWKAGEAQPTLPVGWGEPSRLGLLHLFGNVFEWCTDEREEDGVPYNLLMGGGWASAKAWLQKEIRDGTFGAVWRRRGMAMKDGGFRICLAEGKT